MNAKQQIMTMLKEVYEDGEVNAMEVFKGFALDTGETGWHFRKFGRSNHVYLGKSVSEARIVIDAIKEIRQKSCFVS